MGDLSQDFPSCTKEITIAELKAEHYQDGFGIFHPAPRLSWRFSATTVRDWKQSSYEIAIKRRGRTESFRIDSSKSSLVPWPSSALVSREAVHVSVRATGTNGVQTGWAELTVEAALLKRSDWEASLISGPPQDADKPKPPFRMRKTFAYDGGPARLYATAHGIYQVEINGHVVGDQVLSPGWQSYRHRLHYQTYDVTRYLLPGHNTIGVYLGEGWFAGRLGRPGVSNIWGDRLGFLGQLEANGQVICRTDHTWEVLVDGPVLSSEIYNGEVYDSRQHDPFWSTPQASSGKLYPTAEVLPFPGAVFIAPEAPPVRRVLELQPQRIITTSSGKKVLDFGQNLAGWLRVNIDIPGTGTVTIRHAEVMEHGELGTRPLRTAKASTVIHLGGQTRGYEPKFTFYGFRYAEVTGYDACSLSDFAAIVVSSDLRRTGTFECSHDHVNKLHENTIWSMRGNFISVPTDCPQRDERLGWTGDIQVFTPTASFLYDTAAFIGGWLQDVEADQKDLGGVVPNVVPSIPMPPKHNEKQAMAAWGDTAIFTPWDLYQFFGDEQHLRKQWESMKLWLDKGIPRDKRGCYSTEKPQFGDWLDPRSPPALPGHTPTDPYLVANAYLVHVTEVASKVAGRLGEIEDAKRYREDAQRLRKLFRDEYISPKGRLSSDTQTSYVLALHFNLLDSEVEIQTARSRLDWLTRWEAFKINTGFVGTPHILPTLANIDMMGTAYRMLQERDCPSWLYPITMGATTIWERWNSMLPDGSINPGQMTSFNHYALGAVCHFLHAYVAGLSSATPGWESAIIRPRPGGTILWARATYDSPIGPYCVFWRCESNVMKTSVSIPPNGEARIVLPGIDVVVGSGEYSYETEWHEDLTWPPQIIQGAQGAPVEATYVP
ncbi:Alpha-L-rhamnosidase [Fusarium keratoplasticum]|uniref:Alpha-L-rhamnosidase n=1 Tax=Fusarium keratoplasticum TaxID=1328300 RepID=A0ACC0QFI8_9HYPO|nr:Alpha-L-rhamnosidase [Fusarium keratoplasticum]KAI8651005.1 Alpha-L-rhamnosidase [Fusarium keratoplasticum]